MKEIAADYFNFNKLTLRKKLVAVKNAFSVADEEGKERFFISKKTFSMIEKWFVYPDKASNEVLLSIRQDSFVKPFLIYTVVDHEEKPFAKIKSCFSTFKRRWEITTLDYELIAEAVEDVDKRVFLMRREADIISYHILEDGKEIGHLRRKLMKPNDCLLDLSIHPDSTFDRRLALAFTLASRI